MRKLALTLCFVLLIGMFTGCSPSEKPGETTPAPSAHSLQVGFGRVDATPTAEVSLDGLQETRVTADVADNLYVTCVALTDETGNTVLLYHLDLLYPYNEVLLSLKKVITATGVPYENIMVGSTHNHSAPSCTSDLPGNKDYADQFKTWMVDAAKAAMEDRKPATMAIATAYPENMNFVRHYNLTAGGQGGWARHAKEAESHLYKADNTLQLIKFAREGGKDVLLMNWQGHPMAHGSSKEKIQSDVDVFRKEIEAQQDCLFAYFLGASGDVNSSSDMPSERSADWYENDFGQRGKLMTQYVSEAYKTFRELPAGPVKTLRSQFAVTSVQDGVDAGQKDITLDVVAIGDVAFVCAPYEMFGKNGIAIREGSPFEMTFISTCTNGYWRYLPADYAFEYDCYEITNTTCKVGTAELVAAEYISMLNQLKGTP